MTGDADFLVRIVVPDVASYERLLESLTRIKGVVGLKSKLALKQVKFATALPLTYSATAKRDPSATARAEIIQQLRSADQVALARRNQRGSTGKRHPGR